MDIRLVTKRLVVKTHPTASLTRIELLNTSCPESIELRKGQKGAPDRARAHQIQAVKTTRS